MSNRTNLLTALGAAWCVALFFAGCKQEVPTSPSDGGRDTATACSGGRTMCGSTCVNTDNDPMHCGACNMACASGLVCEARMCKAMCSGDSRLCGTSCANTTNDPTHCGDCVTQCRSDQVCANSACGCAPGQTICNGVCAATCGGGSGGSGGPGSGGSGGPGSGGSGSPGSGGSGAGGGGGRATGSGGTGNPGTGGGGGRATGSGGTGNPGTGGGGGGASGNPAGYWTYPSKSWKGCAWTGIDIVSGTTTTRMPSDFRTHVDGQPYCLMGKVFGDYDAVSLMGFNLNEVPNGNPDQCAFKVADPTAVGPPEVNLTGNGIAVGFKKCVATELRIQIQGMDGGMNGMVGENDRWCYRITQVEGPVFAPFNMFNTKCWDGTGTNYAGQGISAVVFLVPGTDGSETQYNYCVSGFNTGTSTADAPPNPAGGPLMGTIGGMGPRDIDFQRVKVSAGGESYIIQNNNWGTPDSTNQTLSYNGNSFTITGETGQTPDNMKPASFPSIFIGANGDTQNGVYTTRDTDTLGTPGKRINQISNIMSTFRYNRANGDYNATYDIWFASSLPTIRYDDAVSGFVMVWLYKPGARNPIGNTPTRSNVTLSGVPGMWNVYVGPRGGSGSNANAPVVSYVATSTMMGLSNVDLMVFIRDAAQHGINNQWYLTDVFGGFEIWGGGGTNGLSVQEFTAIVQ
jgi:hypothetical protein